MSQTYTRRTVIVGGGPEFTITVDDGVDGFAEESSTLMALRMTDEMGEHELYLSHEDWIVLSRLVEEYFKEKPFKVKPISGDNTKQKLED
jgi:hypothetical protein